MDIATFGRQEMNHYASEPLEALRDEQRFRGTFNQAAVDIVHLATDGRWLLLPSIPKNTYLNEPRTALQKPFAKRLPLGEG